MNDVVFGRIKLTAPVVFNRPAGWEQRLAEVLREASVRSFDERNWNCARFSHSCASAVTGRQLPYRLHKTLEASVDAIFDRHADPRLARRGDVVLAHLNVGKTLGVCTGAEIAFVTAKGLQMEPRSVIRIAWSV